jgi:flagellar protein FliO/FliZ
VLVLAITYFATRWVGGLQKERMTGSNVKILETMRISNSKYIQIVKIGNRCFAMAVCKDTVTYLCDVDEEELVFRDSSAGKFNADNFKAILEKYKKDKPKD